MIPSRSSFLTHTDYKYDDAHPYSSVKHQELADDPQDFFGR